MSDDAKVSPAADGEGSDDEVDEPLPLMRINSFTVKGLGLVHNYVPVVEDDSGKRCVVDGFPENSTMRCVSASGEPPNPTLHQPHI